MDKEKISWLKNIFKGLSSLGHFIVTPTTDKTTSPKPFQYFILRGILISSGKLPRVALFPTEIKRYGSDHCEF